MGWGSEDWWWWWGLKCGVRCSSSLRREHDEALHHGFLKGAVRWGCVSSELTLKLLCWSSSREAGAPSWQVNPAHAVRSLPIPQGEGQHHGPWCVFKNKACFLCAYNFATCSPVAFLLATSNSYRAPSVAHRHQEWGGQTLPRKGGGLPLPLLLGFLRKQC